VEVPLKPSLPSRRHLLHVCVCACKHVGFFSSSLSCSTCSFCFPSNIAAKGCPCRKNCRHLEVACPHGLSHRKRSRQQRKEAGNSTRKKKTTPKGEQSSGKLDVVAGVTALMIAWLFFLQRTDTACSRRLEHVNLTVWQVTLSLNEFKFA